MKNIWVSISGQIAQQKKVDTIANNIANANTAGFKKDSLAFKEHLTALDTGSTDIDIPREDWSPDDFYRARGAQNAYVKVTGSFIDFSQGQMQPTNNKLDFALHGKGFFEVATPAGVQYTRKGTFSLSQEGYLVSEAGHPVLSAKQSDVLEERFIKIPSQSVISVAKDGEIFSKEGVLGKIGVKTFKDTQALKKSGGSLYFNQHPENLLVDTKTSVNQGFIEGSNVNAVREMSELIKAHRHFENIQKAISTYDSISGKAVNDIARF